MSRRRLLLAVLVLAGVGAVALAVTRKSAPPAIPFVKSTRETIVSTLSTNGKVEPAEWASARAERSGVIQKIYVQRGQVVPPGAPLVQLDQSAAASELAQASSQIEQARAQEQTISKGGRGTERTEIENEMVKARLELQIAQRELASAERLLAKQAGTRQEVDSARQRVEAAQDQIRGLEQRRSVLVSSEDRQVAVAKLQEAQAAAANARHNVSLSIIRAPIGGTVYQFDERVGTFVNPGDLIANIGRLTNVRVILYVDEPDLGRVAVGMTVNITWDAMPGRTWKGSVEKLPTQVITLSTGRQVGEVSCIINNPDRDLLPGTNINAEIVSRVVQDAVVIPKEALRRENGQTGVYLLTADQRLEWRPVKVGVSSLTRAEITQGLKEGNSAALPTDKPIRNGQRVEPVYPQSQ